MKKLTPEIKKKIDKAAYEATREVNEMLQDVSHQIISDQNKWLDDMMRDLLPPDLYEAGKHGDMDVEIHSYLTKRDIKIIFIPDSYSIRIMVGDQIHSQFITKLAVDGEPVDMTPTNIGG